MQPGLSSDSADSMASQGSGKGRASKRKRLSSATSNTTTTQPQFKPCEQCRKAKFRCDQTESLPCKRCRTLHIDCKVMIEKEIDKEEMSNLQQDDTEWRLRIEARLDSLTLILDDIVRFLKRDSPQMLYPQHYPYPPPVQPYWPRPGVPFDPRPPMPSYPMPNSHSVMMHRSMSLPFSQTQRPSGLSTPISNSGPMYSPISPAELSDYPQLPPPGFQPTRSSTSTPQPMKYCHLPSYPRPVNFAPPLPRTPAGYGPPFPSLAFPGSNPMFPGGGSMLPGHPYASGMNTPMATPSRPNSKNENTPLYEDTAENLTSMDAHSQQYVSPHPCKTPELI